MNENAQQEGDSPRNGNVRHRFLEMEYQVAADLMSYESQLFWTITGVFLVAETLLAGFLLESDANNQPLFIRVVGTIVGVMAGLVWFAAIRRIEGYHTLRNLQAREIERELKKLASLDGEKFTVFIKGATFAEKGSKGVCVDGVPWSMPWPGHLMPMTRPGMILAVLFTILFVIVFAELARQVPISGPFYETVDSLLRIVAGH